MGSGDMYAVAGAKGGIGKTTTSINLAATLAARKLSVLIIECDLAMANVVDFLSLDIDVAADPTLHEVLASQSTPAEATYDAPGGFSVLPSGVSLEGYVKADPSRLKTVVPNVQPKYDVLLLDVGAGVSFESVIPMKLADHTVLVTTPRVAAVRDTRKTKRLAELAGSSVAGAIFVKSGSGSAPPVERIADYLSVPLLGHIPEDDQVPTSQDAGRPVVVHAPDSRATAAYHDIGARLFRSSESDPPQDNGGTEATQAMIGN